MVKGVFQISLVSLTGETQAVFRQQQEEQNVPQQIDLTEDDDEEAGEEENAADEMDDEADEQVDDEEEDDDMATGYEEGENKVLMKVWLVWASPLQIKTVLFKAFRTTVLSTREIFVK